MSVSKKRAAPRPPVSEMHTAPGGTNKENEKLQKKENGHGEDLNMNENIVLKVVLPDQTADEIEVPAKMPFMDLRMQLCAKYKLSPSSFKLEPIESDGRAIAFTSSSTVGSIDAKAVALKTKAKEPVKIVPPKVVEQTVRLTIKMSQSSKQVLRVRPSVPLSKLLPQILEKTGYKQEKYQYLELRHPDQPTMTLDTSRSLDDYKIREIFVADKRVSVPHKDPESDHEIETMSIQSDDTTPEKSSNKETKKTGSLRKSKKLKALFRLSKKSKHSPLSSPPASEQPSASPRTSPPVPESRSSENIQQPQFANVNENNSKQREEEHIHSSKKKKAPVKHPEPQNEPLHGQVTEKIDEPQKPETIKKQESVESAEHVEEEVKKIVPPRPLAPPRVKPRQQPVPAARLHATGKKKAPPPPTSPDSPGPSSPTRPSRPEKPPRKQSVEKNNKDRPVFDSEKAAEAKETVTDVEQPTEEKPHAPVVEDAVSVQSEDNHEKDTQDEIPIEHDKVDTKHEEVTQNDEVHEPVTQPESSDSDQEDVPLPEPAIVLKSDPEEPAETTEAVVNHGVHPETQTIITGTDGRSDSVSISVSSEEIDVQEEEKQTEVEIEKHVPVVVADPPVKESESEPVPTEHVSDEKQTVLPPELEFYANDIKFDVSQEVYDDDKEESPKIVEEPTPTGNEPHPSESDGIVETEDAVEIPQFQEPVIAVEKEQERRDSESQRIEEFLEEKRCNDDSKSGAEVLNDEDNLFTAPSHYDPNFGQANAPEGEFDFMAAEALARQMISNFDGTAMGSQAVDDESFPPPPQDEFEIQPSPPPPTPAATQSSPGVTTHDAIENGDSYKQKEQEILQLEEQVKFMRIQAAKKKAEEAAAKNSYVILQEKQAAEIGEVQKAGAKTFTFVPNQRAKKVYEDYETAPTVGINLSQSGEIKGLGVPEPREEEKKQETHEKVEPSVLKTGHKTPPIPVKEPDTKPQPESKSPTTATPIPIIKQDQPVVIKEKDPEPQQKPVGVGVPASAPVLPKGLTGYVASAAMRRQNVQTSQSKPYVPSQAAQDKEMSSSKRSSLPNYYKKFLGMKALQSAVENKEQEETVTKPAVVKTSIPEEKTVPNGELSPSKPNPPVKPEALKQAHSPPPVKAAQPKQQDVKIVEKPNSPKIQTPSSPVKQTVKIEPVDQLPSPPEEQKSPPQITSPVTNIDDVPLPPPPEEFLTPVNNVSKPEAPASLEFSRSSSASSSTSSTKSPGFSPRTSNFVGISAAKPFSPGGGSKPTFRPMSAAFKDDANANNLHLGTNYDDLIWNQRNY